MTVAEILALIMGPVFAGSRITIKGPDKLVRLGQRWAGVYMNQNRDMVIQMLAVSRILERIADHTSNIAEDVIYMVDGDVVRYGGRSY